MPAGVPLTTNFKDSTGADLGTKLVEKDYLLEVYPNIYANLLKDTQGYVWGVCNGKNNGAVSSGSTCYNTPCVTWFNNQDWKCVATSTGDAFSVNGAAAFAVIKTDGSLWTWGDNTGGVLGTGDLFGPQFTSSPVQTISGGNNWKTVTMSMTSGTAAAIKTDGTLWLWGVNNYGSIGNQSVDNVSSPVQTIAVGSNWRTVSLGGYSTAAVKTDGTLWTWGKNCCGKLGHNTGITQHRSSPVQVSGGGTTWCAASMGRLHMLALKNDNTLWAAGSNICGALGDQTLLVPSDRSALIQITGTTWCAIAAGNCVSTAIKTDGTLWTWGTNFVGVLGINEGFGFRCSPVQTSSTGNTWKKVVLRDRSIFAIKSDSSLWVWGCNTCGHLGTGDDNDRSSPVKISSGWSDIAAGPYTSIGIRNEELYLCNVTNFRFTDSASGLGSVDFDDVYIRTCCYSEAGVWMWGNNHKCRLAISGGVSRCSPTQTTTLPGAGWKEVESDKQTYTSSGDSGGGGAAIKTDGTLWLWGSEAFGKLGNGIDQDSSNFKCSPVQTISQGNNWKLVSRGRATTAAIKTDGTLWIWGINEVGQLGIGLDYSSANAKCSPVQTISQGTNWCKIKVGSNQVVAIKTDGTLWTWGRNDFGQLGDGTTIYKSSPVQTIAQGTNWRDISLGTYHTIATKTDGSLWAWGCNRYGQLGNNLSGFGTGFSSPVQVVGNNWRNISATDFFSGAIKNDGTLWMWGRNLYGNLGIGNDSNQSSPTQVGTENAWRTISLGRCANSAAIKYDGTLWTWGRNQCGVLGDGTTINKSSPIQTLAGGNNWKQVSAGTAIFALRENCW